MPALRRTAEGRNPAAREGRWDPSGQPERRPNPGNRPKKKAPPKRGFSFVMLQAGGIPPSPILKPTPHAPSSRYPTHSRPQLKAGKSDSAARPRAALEPNEGVTN